MAKRSVNDVNSAFKSAKSNMNMGFTAVKKEAEKPLKYSYQKLPVARNKSTPIPDKAPTASKKTANMLKREASRRK